MNKKSMIIFICWVTLCIGLVVFMIIHIIIQQNIALAKHSEESINSLINIWGGKRL